VIKITVIVDSFEVPFWIYKIIEFCDSKSQLFLTVCVVQGYGVDSKKPRDGFSSLLFDKYLAVDKKRVAEYTSQYPRVNLRERFPDVTYIVENSRTFKHKEKLLDTSQLILLFCRLAREDYIRLSASLGVWFCRFGESPSWEERISGFYEIHNRKLVSESSLINKNTSTLESSIIYKNQIRTDFKSATRNRTRLELSAVTLFTDAISGLTEPKKSSIDYLPKNDNTDCAEEVNVRVPGNLAMLKFSFHLICSFLGNRIFAKNRNIEQWSIGYNASHPIDWGDGCIENTKWFYPDGDRFVADPFPIKRDDRWYVFLEEYRYKSAKGVISFLEVDSDGNFGELNVVMKEKHHMSFPHIFEDDGLLYMIPEQNEISKVILYSCVEFPLKWKPLTVLLEGAFSDVVLFKRDNIYWLFGTRADYYNNDNNLRLYFASALTAPFRSHPKNPVSLDISKSRMAGNLFTHQSELYRPAQNCLVRYGHSLQFLRVDVLSTTDYQETLIKSVVCESGDFNRRFHTINTVDGLNFIDGSRLLKTNK